MNRIRGLNRSLTPGFSQVSPGKRHGQNDETVSRFLASPFVTLKWGVAERRFA